MQSNVQKAGKVARLVLLLIVEFVLSSKLFSNSSTLFVEVSASTSKSWR